MQLQYRRPGKVNEKPGMVIFTSVSICIEQCCKIPKITNCLSGHWPVIIFKLDVKKYDSQQHKDKYLRISRKELKGLTTTN